MCVKIFLALIMATHPNPKHKSAKIIAKNLCYYSKKRGLDPYLVLGIIKHESDFMVKCISKTNDYGLMQINLKYRKYKCNLFNIKCNIKEGTREMAVWKRICLKNHNHRHWLRHYNWHNRNHHLRVLWLAEAYKRDKPHLMKIIKKRRYVQLKLNYKCIEEDLCGVEKCGQKRVEK